MCTLLPLYVFLWGFCTLHRFMHTDPLSVYSMSALFYFICLLEYIFILSCFRFLLVNSYLMHCTVCTLFVPFAAVQYWIFPMDETTSHLILKGSVVWRYDMTLPQGLPEAWKKVFLAASNQKCHKLYKSIMKNLLTKKLTTKLTFSHFAKWKINTILIPDCFRHAMTKAKV